MYIYVYVQTISAVCVIFDSPTSFSMLPHLVKAVDRQTESAQSAPSTHLLQFSLNTVT